nr:OmpA family protein [uncultured Sphingomonas sp.]
MALPNGQSIDLAPNTLNYDLQRYLGSNEATPKTFQFDKLNFETGSAAIRAEDQANVDALAQILAAYPKARVQIVGYTDARGAAPTNAQLGQQRADSVTTALTAKGIDKTRIESVSGGEANPTDTNATTQGQFENRRTELVVTAK